MFSGNLSQNGCLMLKGHFCLLDGVSQVLLSLDTFWPRPVEHESKSQEGLK